MHIADEHNPHVSQFTCKAATIGRGRLATSTPRIETEDMRTTLKTGVGVMIVTLYGCATPPIVSVEGQSNDRARAKLSMPMSVNYDNSPLGRAIERITEATGATIWVNWRALEGAGLDESSSVTFSADDVPADLVLGKVLDDVGGDLVPVGYVIDSGVVTVSTIENLNKITELRVYNCRDLLDDSGDPARADEDARLIEQIVRIIGGDVWDGPDVSDDVIRYRGLLLIRTSASHHDRIEQYLNTVRTAIGSRPGAVIPPR